MPARHDHRSVGELSGHPSSASHVEPLQGSRALKKVVRDPVAAPKVEYSSTRSRSHSEMWLRTPSPRKRSSHRMMAP